nr:hypothetical protein [Tanacetum cinerariifolium]
EKWSTLREPSGKWDYYVRYDAPINTTPLEEIAATGWGEEFSDDEVNQEEFSDDEVTQEEFSDDEVTREEFSDDEVNQEEFSDDEVTQEEFSDDEVTREEFSADEVTPGKVTIMNKAEEESDWDDDERSGGKNLAIQERHAQNQQDFLDKYLPQWDNLLATQKQKSKLEWENPFAANRGEDHIILHLSKEEENDDDLPYPKFRKFEQVAAQIIKKHEEHVFPSTSQEESTQSYQPPHDSIMGPSVYPPVKQNPQSFYRPDYQFGYPQGKNPGLWSEVISRWESITINRLNNQTWQLATKSGRLYFPSTTEKLFAKLLPSLSKKIEESFRAKYPGLNSGVLPAIEIWNEKIKNIQRKAA